MEMAIEAVINFTEEKSSKIRMGKILESTLLLSA